MSRLFLNKQELERVGPAVGSVGVGVMVAGPGVSVGLGSGVGVVG